MLSNCSDELPNPHKNCLREMLNTLICNDQDVKRLNTELRNLQLELQEELRKLETRSGDCGANKAAAPAPGTVRVSKTRLCDQANDVAEFTKKLISMDELKHFFTKRFEEIRKRRDSIIIYARQCLQAYNEEKCKFKAFHENTTDYIKRTATLSQDPTVIKRCERDICEMHKRFVKEVANLKHCEQQLQPFVKLLKESDPMAYCECCCFKEYDWMPPGKNMGAVDAVSQDLKDKMSKTLVGAFAQLHLHMPQDMYGFIAGYLMNVERNEHEVQEKLNIFQDHEEGETKELADPTYRCDTECPKNK